MAATIRGEVNEEIFAMVAGRLGPAGVARLEALLEVPGRGPRATFNRLKKTAPRPSWTNFRASSITCAGSTDSATPGAWWQGVAASKIADFAGEAAAADAAVMRDYGGPPSGSALAGRDGVIRAEPGPATTRRRCSAGGWPR